MSKLAETLHLDQPPEDVRRVCLDRLGRLGWEVRESQDGFEVAEDATRLCCVESPASGHLRFRVSETGGTTLEVEASVPGFGPIASRNVRSRMALLIRACEKAPGEPSA